MDIVLPDLIQYCFLIWSESTVLVHSGYQHFIVLLIVWNQFLRLKMSPDNCVT